MRYVSLKSFPWTTKDGGNRRGVKFNASKDEPIETGKGIQEEQNEIEEIKYNIDTVFKMTH